MRLLWRLGKKQYVIRPYILSLFSQPLLTIVNLAYPDLIFHDFDCGKRKTVNAKDKIMGLTIALIILYLLRILFRYFSNFLAHKAAWNLVEHMRSKIYEKIQSLSMSFFMISRLEI